MKTQHKTLLFLTGIRFGRKGRRDMLRSQRGQHEQVCLETMKRIAAKHAEPTPHIEEYLKQTKPSL